MVVCYLNIFPYFRRHTHIHKHTPKQQQQTNKKPTLYSTFINPSINNCRISLKSPPILLISTTHLHS